MGAVALAVTCAQPAGAMRIISLAPSVTETLFAIGAGDEVVGVSSYCDYPPAVQAIDRVGTFLAPNVEVILAKRPDLVIGVPSPGNRGSVESLGGLGIQLLIVDPQTVEEITSTIERIAAAVGRAEAGRSLRRRIEADIAATRDRLAGVSPRKVLMVVGRTPLVAVGRKVFQNELIELARGVNIAEGMGAEWPHLSLELVIAEAPEVIIDTTMGTERPALETASGFWQRLSTLPAVREGRVYGYRQDALLRPGPRIAAAFRTLAALIHPERFPEGSVVEPR